MLLYKARFYVTRKSPVSLYYFYLVYPYLTYYNVIWSSEYPTNSKIECTCCKKELFEQSVMQITGLLANPFFKSLPF